MKIPRTKHPRWDKRSFGAVAAAAGAVALTATMVTHPFAAHAGLGAVADANAQGAPMCTNGYQPRTGYSLDVCLAGSGTTVTPSINVHQLGGTSCQISLEIWDDANNKLAAQSLPCSTGPATGTPLDLTQLSGVTANTHPDGSLTVHAFARLIIGGQGVYIPGQGNSPTVTVPAASSPGTGGSGGTASGSPASSTVATALQDTQTDDFFALRTDLTTSMNGADMDAYLTQLGTSGRQRLNNILAKGFSPSDRFTVTNAMLTKASASTIQASKQDLTAWQPILDTKAAPGVKWGWSQTTPSLFPSSGPSVQDASQGQLNDCYFHAELLAIVQNHQAWLSNHIAANNNGTVTATFYRNGAAVPVTVTTDLPYDGSRFPYGGARTSSWMALYEKAYAQLLGGYTALNGENVASTQAWTGAAYGALTGSPDTRVGGFGLQPGLGIGNPPSLQTISQWLATGDVVTTSTYPRGATNDRFPATVISQDPDTGGQRLQGVVPAHEYTVVSVDTVDSTLTLINPWGPGLTWQDDHAAIPFQFTVTAADYAKYFMDAAYDQVPDPIATTN